MMKFLCVVFFSTLVAAFNVSTVVPNMSQISAIRSSDDILFSSMFRDPAYTSVISIMRVRGGAPASMYLSGTFSRGTPFTVIGNYYDSLMTQLPTEAQSFYQSFQSVRTAMYYSILSAEVTTTSLSGSGSGVVTRSSSVLTTSSTQGVGLTTSAPTETIPAATVLTTSTRSQSSTTATSTGGVGRGEAGYAVLVGVVGVAAALL